MNYDFDKMTDRRGTNSVKWDEAGDSVLPMWVADMDFATAPVVQEAIMRRAQHPCYGYVLVPDAYYEAIIGWQRRRHQWQIERDWILYTIGVVPAVSACIKAITQPGDKVIILSPVYNCFYSSIHNCGCQVEEVPLIEQWDAVQQRLTYALDKRALAHAAADSKATALLLCNPHNPVGHCWTREELHQIARICQRHGVTVISDEIHCELTAPGTDYTPWGALDCQDDIPQEDLPRYVTCTSPSKAYNIAGLQNAYLICPDAELRRRIDRVINIHETCDVNPFGVEALIAAYSQEGEVWLDDLRQYLWDNYHEAAQMLLEAFPDIRIADLQATYLMWVDVRPWCQGTTAALSHRLIEQHGLWVTAGETYGEAGMGYLRINLACPRAKMREGIRRLIQGLQRADSVE